VRAPDAPLTPVDLEARERVAGGHPPPCS
jgi:hypothetical protein